MRWTELGGKEIINLANGQRIGPLGQADLALDEESGQVVEIVVPRRRGLVEARREIVIPWAAVRRVGPEVIIVEIEGHDRPRRRPRGKD